MKTIENLGYLFLNQVPCLIFSGRVKENQLKNSPKGQLEQQQLQRKAQNKKKAKTKTNRKPDKFR